MSRGRAGVMPPGIIVRPNKRGGVEPPPEDITKRFLFLNPRPNGKGTPKAPYTRRQNRGHKLKAPKVPKHIKPFKIKVVVRVELGKELLAQRDPKDKSTWKAFTIHTVGITKRGTFYLCMVDPRVVKQLRERGYKVPKTDMLRVVHDDNPTVWIPNLEAYSWWYPQPRPPEPTEQSEQQ